MGNIVGSRGPRYSSRLDTPAKRRRLEARRNPYWMSIGARSGVSVGYRKGARTGVWVAKAVQGPIRLETTLGSADDEPGSDHLSFKQATVNALTWAEEEMARALKQRGGDAPPTLEDAIKAYRRDRAKAGGDVDGNLGRLEKHAKEALRTTKLRDLPDALPAWRDGLLVEVKVAETAKEQPTDHQIPTKPQGKRAKQQRKGIRAATVNRTLTVMRAVLNYAAERWPNEIAPANFRAPLKAIPNATEARRIILSPAELAAIVAAAKDESPEFYRLVLVLASTGARIGQIAAMTVADAQISAKVPTLMVPPSKKGRRGTQKHEIRLPIPDELVRELRPVVTDREPAARLLVREDGEPWHKTDHTRRFARTAKRAEVREGKLPIYALRHTWIADRLKASMPTKLVAALADTSTAMIERHYARFIADHADAVVLAAMPRFEAANVAQLKAVQ